MASNKLANVYTSLVCGICPGCGERLEFMQGRCSYGSSPEELDTKLTKWIHENRDIVKTTITKYYEVIKKLAKCSWHDYDDVFDENDTKTILKQINKLCMELRTMLPIVGLIQMHETELEVSSHEIHILKTLTVDTPSVN